MQEQQPTDHNLTEQQPNPEMTLPASFASKESVGRALEYILSNPDVYPPDKDDPPNADLKSVTLKLASNQGGIMSVDSRQDGSITVVMHVGMHVASPSGIEESWTNKFYTYIPDDNAPELKIGQLKGNDPEGTPYERTDATEYDAKLLLADLAESTPFDDQS